MARIGKRSLVVILLCCCNLHAEGPRGCGASIDGGRPRLLTQVQPTGEHETLFFRLFALVTSVQCGLLETVSQKRTIKMANVAVKKATGPAKETLPVFAEWSEGFEEIQRRALGYFEKRGAAPEMSWRTG